MPACLEVPQCLSGPLARLASNSGAGMSPAPVSAAAPAHPLASDTPIFRWLGTADYLATWQRMQTFTAQRDAQTRDEIWFLEHPPVYTLGLNGQVRHLLAANGIPVVHVDRGGQITYHGPGQLVVYPLLNLRRLQLGVRDLVIALEHTIIKTVQQWGIEAVGRRDAPGVYVDGRKLASIGLRVRRGCSYHGLAFNIDMDLSPFGGINPCGFENLEVTQLRALGGPGDVRQVAESVLPQLAQALGLRHSASWQ